MKSRLSEPTIQLIQSLYAKRRFWDKLPHPDVKDAIIRKIGEAGEAAAILDLLPILVTANRKLALTCAETIQHLLLQLKPADLVRFDEYMRQGYYTWGADLERWNSIRSADIAYLAGTGIVSASLLGVASCHANGYIREEAIRELGKIETGTELPFLLLRANDWVSAIRLSARNLLTIRVRPDYARHFVDWLPLVIRLSQTSRDDQSWILDAVQRLLQDPEVRQTLYEGFQSQDYRARRFCFQVALKLSGTELVTTMHQAFESGDPHVRKSAAQQLVISLPSAMLKEFLVRARNDSWMPVRRKALHLYAEKYPSEAEGEFHAALLDPNVAIREEAQYFFRNKATLELGSYYSATLETAEGAQLAAAISGLGEVGEPNDSRLIERFTSSPSARVRMACVRALAKLNPNSCLEQFLHALGDPSAKVAREALLALNKRANSIGGQRLWELYSGSHHLHAKRSALYLLARISKWDSITFLIQSLADENSSLVELSKNYITRWFARYNRSFVAPTADQLATLRGVLSRCGLILNSGTQEQLDSLLRSFS